MFELNEDEDYDISKLCEAIGVSRSGYYKWLNRPASGQELETEQLAVEIKRIYDESDSTYGVQRIHLAVNRELDVLFNIKRIRRLMRIDGISSKRPNYVKSIPKHTYENIINREFTATSPNQK